MSKLRTQRLPGIRSASRQWFSFTSFASSTSFTSVFSHHSPLATRHFLLAAILLLLSTRSAVALDPSLDISQYAHTSWKVRDGFTKGAIIAIAQTPDGYLWLGTEFGLVRFDGVRAVPWQPPAGEQLPSSYIVKLLAARDGTLWIGTAKGLASLKDGRLKLYTELNGQAIFAILEEHEGTIWIGAVSLSGKLCAIESGGVRCYGENGSLGQGVTSLYEDSKGNLWAGVLNGVWRWKPGPSKFYSVPGEPNGIQGLAEEADGTLLVATPTGIRQLVRGKIEPYPMPDTIRRVDTQRLLRDRDGGLWIGTVTHAIAHKHHGRTDFFAQPNGLSSDDILAIFEDREGNIWIGTINGLDRFREFGVRTFSVIEGLSNPVVGSVLADKDGSVWISTWTGLDRWNNGQVVAYRGHKWKLNGSLFQDSRGRIWASTSDGFGYLESDRFISVGGLPGGSVHGIAEDAAGNLWVANQRNGLFRVSARSEVRQIPWGNFGRRDYATALSADPWRGGLWLGFHDGGVVYWKDGQVRASYGSVDGLGEGWVGRLRSDPDGTVWAATQGGLSRLKNGRIATLTSKNGLPCDPVHWVMEDDDYAFWLLMPCALVRVSRSEVDAWTAAVDKDKDTKGKIQATVFDSSDGVRSHGFPNGYTPHVSRASDGELWFATLDGVSVIDPKHLPFNKLSPPVHIEQISADGKVYDSSAMGSRRLRLPTRIRNLDIDYTALSLVVPEKVRFRVKLEGQDKDWRELVNVRHVEYTNLAPKTYRFLVKACNNSGVWNEEGAALTLIIPPMWYQTNWFLALCVAAFLALLWALYQLRLHQMAREFNTRLEERVSERTRIARDLHDTLLQSFHGILLRMQILSNELSDGNTKEKLETVIDEAEHAIVEGRDAVQGLRASTVERNDLAAAIRTLGEELAADDSSSHRPDFSVQVEGAPRNLHPILRDEVYRIAGEAMRNAFRHADAQRIEVEIRYDERQLRVRVRDDGKGIDLKLMGDNGREGHFGLRGMRERAKLIGGKLTLWSELDSGTEVELTIPAARAYVTAPEPRRSRLVEKLAGKLKGKDTELKS